MNEPTSRGQSAEDQSGQIRAAYDRLTDSASPPRDASVLIQRRIRTRQVRRRAGVATVAVLGASALAFTLLGGGPGTSGDVVADQPTASPSASPSEQPTAESTPGQGDLTFTRTDGTTYTFDNVGVSCDTPGKDDVQRLTAMSTPVVEEDELVEPFFTLEARLDKISPGQEFELPIDVGRSGANPLILFFADSASVDAGADRANELSSAEASTGTVTVVSASCGDIPQVELVVDAVLGSEVQQESLPISGRLSAP